MRLLHAALALLCAPGALGCGNEDKPARVDARALAGAGFAAVGADSVGMRFTAERRDGVVHVRLQAAGEGLLSVLPMMQGVHARIEAFWPPPGILKVVRRRGAAIRILSPYGELLAGVRTRARVLLMSFGGGPVPMRPAQAAAGRLVLAAGPDALGALRDTLPPRATKALEGARRLVAVMPLPGDGTRFLASPSKG